MADTQSSGYHTGTSKESATKTSMVYVCSGNKKIMEFNKII